MTFPFSCFSLSATPAVSLDLSLAVSEVQEELIAACLGPASIFSDLFRGSVLLPLCWALFLPLFLPCSPDLHRRNFTVCAWQVCLATISCKRCSHTFLVVFSFYLVFLVYCVLYQDLQFWDSFALSIPSLKLIHIVIKFMFCN